LGEQEINELTAFAPALYARQEWIRGRSPVRWSRKSGRLVISEAARLGQYDCGNSMSPNADGGTPMSRRSNLLAERLEQGARALEALANELTDAEWQTPLPKDGRKIGVVIHHVASMYPLEMTLAQNLAEGKPIAGVTWDAVHE